MWLRPFLDIQGHGVPSQNIFLAHSDLDDFHWGRWWRRGWGWWRGLCRHPSRHFTNSIASTPTFWVGEGFEGNSQASAGPGTPEVQLAHWHNDGHPSGRAQCHRREEFGDESGNSQVPFWTQCFSIYTKLYPSAYLSYTKISSKQNATNILTLLFSSVAYALSVDVFRYDMISVLPFLTCFWYWIGFLKAFQSP